MTKEELQKDIERLQKQAAQYLANFNATNGAIEYAVGMLAKCHETKQEEKTES